MLFRAVILGCDFEKQKLLYLKPEFILKNIIAIFYTLFSLEFVTNEFSVNTVDFGIGSSFSSKGRPLVDLFYKRSRVGFL